MSDTPRTDENEAFINRATGCHCHVDSDFARQLERELNAAKANAIDEAVKRMEEVPTYELDEIWFERTGLEWDFDDAMERIRTRLISGAKGEQL